MKQGDDIFVELDGVEFPGQVERSERGWTVATVAIDPEADLGSGTERLAPYQTVCVPDGRVRPA